MKKTFHIIIFALIVALFLVGCQSGDEEVDVAEPTVAETTVDEPVVDEPNVDESTEEEAEQESITLTLLASQGWVKDSELELAQQYEEATGVHIDYQILPADQYFNVLTTKLNADEGPDIFMGQSGQSDLKVLYDVEQNAVDLSDQEWVSRMDPASRKMVSLDGKVYGAEIWDTIASNYFVMVYNKDIFSDLGLSVPASFAEFMDACVAIQDAGIVPVYQPVSDGWHHVLWFPMIGPRFEEANPGLAAELNANETTFADVAIMQEALTQLQELYESGCFGDNALSDAFSDANGKLANGEYAMALTTLTAPTSIEADFDVPASTFGFFPIPLADNQLAPAHPAGPAKFIYSGSPYIEEAKQYLAFLTEPENLQYLLDNTDEFAALNFDGVEPKWNEAQQEFLDSYPATTLVYQDVVNYLNPQWMDIGRDLESMFIGQMSPEDVLQSIDQRRTEMATTAADPAWEQ